MKEIARLKAEIVKLGAEENTALAKIANLKKGGGCQIKLLAESVVGDVLNQVKMDAIKRRIKAAKGVTKGAALVEKGDKTKVIALEKE